MEKNRFIESITKTLELASVFGSVWSDRFLRMRSGQVPFVNLYITERCNSRCRTCNTWKEQKSDNPELTTEEILSLAPAMRRIGTRLISICGGEPTLRDDLELCIAGFRDAGIAVHMNTNGQKIDLSRAESLANAGLSVVYISCDHADPEGYQEIRGIDGLDRVAAAVAHFRALPAPVAVGINITVSSLNQDALDRIVDMCMKWDVQKIQFDLAQNQHGLLKSGISEKDFQPLTPVDMISVKQKLLRLTARIRKRNISTNSNLFIKHFVNAHNPVRVAPCLAGYLFLNIDCAGEVFPCYEYRTGLNVRDIPLNEIINSAGFKEQRACVTHCKTPCHNTGSVESSIRFHPPYLAAHLYETYRQARMHLS